MKLLVTGSDGLVGSAIRRLNPADAFFATREKADLTEFSATMKLFEKVQPTHVVHLAAVVGGIGGNLMHSGDFFRKNILINANVLEAARVAGVQRLVSFMSTCIFPNDAPYPLSVENLHDGPPHPSNFGYAYAKRMLEVQTRAYKAQWGLEFNVAIPTNIYGPHDNWNLVEGHVVPSLIHRCFLAKAKGESLSVWGSGNPLREFIYSDDVARLALWLIHEKAISEPLILTSGIETSIRELVGYVVESLDFQGEVCFDSTKPDGQMRKPSNDEPLRALDPPGSFVTLKEGIQKTVEWFIANYPNVRM